MKICILTAFAILAITSSVLATDEDKNQITKPTPVSTNQKQKFNKLEKAINSYIKTTDKNREKVPVELSKVPEKRNTKKERSIGFGFKGGVDFSKYNPYYDSKSRMGFIGGYFLDYKMGGFLSFQPELNYVAKVTQEDYLVYWTSPLGTHYGKDTSTNTYSYLEIPLLFKVRLKSSGPLGFNLFAGPSFAFLVNAKEHMTENSPDGTYYDFGTTNIINNLQVFDIGIVFGGEVEYKKLLFDIRYDMDLNGIDRGDSFSLGRKNRTFSLMAGYRIF